MTQFQIRQCTNSTCRFRFPVTPQDRIGNDCPSCGSPVQLALEQTTAPASGASAPLVRARPLHVLLDNVRSTFNVGSIFRTADGAAVQQLYLCGITPTPSHPKVGKTALGAEQVLAWSHHNNAVDLACSLQAKGATLWALEDNLRAESLFKPPLRADNAPGQPMVDANAPLVLIVGNEITGVDPGLLALCTRILAIPMWGVKQSLNVATAFGIAIYELRRQLALPSFSETEKHVSEERRTA